MGEASLARKAGGSKLPHSRGVAFDRCDGEADGYAEAAHQKNAGRKLALRGVWSAAACRR